MPSIGSCSPEAEEERAMSNVSRTVLVAMVVIGAATAAQAQSVPYETQYDLPGAGRRSDTAIIVSPRLHPEVEVSRTLSAQPVHPHMVKVVVGGGYSRTGKINGAVHTWIDPLRRLDGHEGLDENHSLVRAQRLYLSLSGMTTREVHETQYHSWKLQQTYAGQSRAYIVVSPKARQAAPAEHEPRPLMVIPKPVHQSRPVAPMPTVPKQQEADRDDLVAQAESGSVPADADTEHALVASSDD
jgi:hypothetical protein